MDDKKVDRALEAWKITIGVQQHFNDIQMKVRNYALTLLLAVIAGAGFAIREDDLSLAAGILLGGLIVWLLFWWMDDAWYHRLLVGAVKHGLRLEEQLADDVPGIGLSGTIKDESPLRIKGVQIPSRWKLRLFYAVVAIGLLIASTVSFVTRAREDPPAPTPGPAPLSTLRLPSD